MRPTIYVGLGGTGIRAISQAKKMYEDVYGEGKIPKCIAFLAVDFNLKDIDSPNLATPMGADAVPLQYNGSPREHYETRSKKGAYKWMFDGNTGSLQNKITDGAGQVRTTGRFYTEYIMSSIEPAMQRCWQQVSNITYVNDEGFTVPCEEIDIHVVMSVAGGTGAGSFINVAEMIHRTYGKRAHIIGYGVLHGVFRTMDPMGNQTRRVRENAYAAIMDLDYLMSAEINNPVTFEINGAMRTFTQPIFHEFFVIDNTTAHGNIIGNVDALCEAIGTCLFSSSGDMGTKIQGGQSNNRWTQGNYGILHKKGWVQALGGCQVVYKGELMAEIYAKKTAAELIRKMCQEGANAQQLATKWTETAKVREDGDTYNMLIDSIFDSQKIEAIKLPRTDISDTIVETNAKIETYTNNLADFPTDETITALKEEKVNMLNNEIEEILRREGGVGDAKQFLESLKPILEGYSKEMTGEASEFSRSQANASEALSKKQKEYEVYRNRLITFDKKKQELLDEVNRKAKDKLKNAYEIKRRQVANEVFIMLTNAVAVRLQRICEIIQMLDELRSKYNREANENQNLNGNAHVFEYDLSTAERANIQINDEDINLATFNSTLDKSLLEIDINSELEPAIYNYAKSRPQAEAYRTKRLIDIINALSDDAYARLKDAIQTKSSTLLRINNRGQENDDGMPTELMVREYMFSLYSDAEESCRLQGDDSFIRSATGAAGCQFVPNNLEQLRQKMYVFRADYAVIPYCIDSLDETVQDAYEKQVRNSSSGQVGFNPHFDKTLFDEMRLKNFKLEPELPNEAMFYWICGQIFGYTEVTETSYSMEKDKDNTPIKIASKVDVTHPKYICCRKGKYYFWEAKKRENGADKKWYPIGGLSTGDRMKAYENFKAITLAEYKSDLHDFITKVITDKGNARLTAEIEQLKQMGKEDYIDTILCTDKSSATYYAQRKHELTQIEDEWDYIENEFMNAIKNFK